MHQYQQEFIELARAQDALKFGEFTLKSGRVSPYFFNAGAFCTGSALAALGRAAELRSVRRHLDLDMEWSKVSAELGWDGSLRDLYVAGALEERLL